MARALSAGGSTWWAAAARTQVHPVREAARDTGAPQAASELRGSRAVRLRTFASGLCGAVRLLTLAAGLCAGAEMAQKKPPPG